MTSQPGTRGTPSRSRIGSCANTFVTRDRTVKAMGGNESFMIVGLLGIHSYVHRFFLPESFDDTVLAAADVGDVDGTRDVAIFDADVVVPVTVFSPICSGKAWRSSSPKD